MILIDPPAWPAHGRLWSHLVSDVSIAELHAFAAANGVPRRSFDLDHYDVPQERYDDLAAAGAEQVAARVLLRRLQLAGLRVRQVDKHHEGRRQAKAELRRRWIVLRQGSATKDDWHDLGEDLLVRWSETHRHYHTVDHLLDVLIALDQLALWGEEVSDDVRLAAWFHDAIYEGSPTDEERSAELAEGALVQVGCSAPQAAAVRDLVLAIRPGAPHESHDAQVLTDADVAILSAPPKRYRFYTEQVRREYAHVHDDAFRAGRAAVMSTYLAAPRIYGTTSAYDVWEPRARANLTIEIENLVDD